MEYGSQVSNVASTKQQVMELVRDLFTEDRAGQIIESEAFGALVYRINVSGFTPGEVFQKLDEDMLEFTEEGATDPAAYLAAKVRDL